MKDLYTGRLSGPPMSHEDYLADLHAREQAEAEAALPKLAGAHEPKHGGKKSDPKSDK